MTTTLVHLLEARAAELAERTVYHFLSDGEVHGPREQMSALALAQSARAIGAQLVGAGARGRPVLILMPPGLEFVRAFFGCLYAGAIAVPVYPPEPARLERGIERLRRVLENCEAAHVLTCAALAPLVETLLGQVAVLSSDLAPPAPEFQPVPGDVALLQYTSGSTQSPRGVVLGHEQLLENAGQIASAFRVTSEMRLVSWLPPYHDMGLIGGVLQPLYLGAEVLGLSPLHFMQQPLRWLEAITHFGANTSGGPNFAFDLVRRRATEQDRAALELSSWRVAFNGAEPIRADTQQRFAEAFRGCGFSATAFVPCYGLAEATLLVAAATPGREPRVHVVDEAALEQRIVRDAAGARGRSLVSSGTLAPGVELAVVDPESRALAPANGVGELWLRGPNIARGYFRNPELSAELFGAELDGSESWLRTGDLGALIDGELVVTGRLKDLLVVRGRNLYPQDVESSVTAAHPQIRAGNVVVFATADEGVAVVAEVRPDTTAFEAVLDAIDQAVLSSHDVAPERVALVAPGSIVKTSSGKLARAATRKALESRLLTPLASRTRAQPMDADSLYSDLRQAFRRLDARSTRYQFNLERDIPWSRLNEPGDYYPRALLESYGYDIPGIQSVTGAWSLLQRRTALSVAAGFDLLEDALLGFATREARHFRGVRSVEVLCDEERKHVALFRRLTAHLTAQSPELAADAARESQVLRDALVSFADHRRFPSVAAYHYCWWLLVLFFEELTVWLGGALAETENVQPTWLAAHQAHAREETQHVLTDFACLQALNASEEERLAWSALVFEQIVPLLALALSPDAALRGALRQFPAIPGRGRLTTPLESPFVRLLSQPAFSRTRAAGPHFMRVTGARAPVVAPQSEPAASDHEGWIIAWVAGAVGVTLDRHDNLQAAGLDSVSALSLCGALEQRLGLRLPTSCVYDYPTPASLARFAQTRSEASAQLADAEREPLLARQRRLLALDRARPAEVLDHLSAVFTLPVSDAEEVRDALSRIIVRHPSLWRRYVASDDGAFAPESLPIDHALPLTHEQREFDDRALAVRAAELDGVPFELSLGPPFRAELWQAREHAALILSIHHVCADGWSLALLFRELAAECRGELLAAPRPVSLAREQAQLGSAEGAARLDFWRAELREQPCCKRPVRPASQHIESARGELSRLEWEQVQALARRYAATPYIVLLTAFHFAWRRCAEAPGQLVAAHLFNRVSEDERRAVDYLVNVLTLRTELEDEPSFGVAVERVRHAWLQALDHDISVDHLVRHVFPERYLERWMPARVAFNQLLTRGERDGDWRWRHELAAKPRFLFFDGMFVVLPDTERLRFTFWHDADAISAREAESLVLEFKSVLLNLTKSASDPRREEGAA